MMSERHSDVVWDYVRPSSSFHNVGTYAPPSTPRVHAFPAVPRTEPADCETEPPVGGIGVDIRKSRHNPYRGGLESFDRRFTYLREGGHQVSRSPGPGNYETRHLTGGALVKHPGTASSCFRRPGGRLEFGQGGTWHEETPLESAERRGTVRGSLKTQPQHYSLSFRSKADRLVVNKPPNTTHAGVGPGCYDLSKDGKSVGVKTEKRVGRRSNEGRGSTNQFLVDWRAYMKRPPTPNDGYGGSGGLVGGGRGGSSRGKTEPSRPQPTPHAPPETPQKVSYALNRQNESWPAPRKWPPAATAGRAGEGGGEQGSSRKSEQRSLRGGLSHQRRRSEQNVEAFFPQRQGQGQEHQQHQKHTKRQKHQQQHQLQRDNQQQQEQLQKQPQQQQKASDLPRRSKRPASAFASVRIPSATAPAPNTRAFPPRRSFNLRRRVRNRNETFCSGRGGGAGGDSRSVLSAIFSETGSCAAVSTCSAGGGLESPQFVPRPPSVDFVCRKRPTTPTKTERVASQIVADTCVDNGRDCISGWSGAGGGETGADAIRADAPTKKSTLQGEEAVVRTPPSSPSIETDDVTKRRPPTPKTVDREKPDEARCGEIVVVPSLAVGHIKVNPPRRATRPAFDPRPEVPGKIAASFAGDAGGSHEKGLADIENEVTIVGNPEPATGRSSGSSTAAAITASRPDSTINGVFEKVGQTVGRKQETDRGDRPSPSYGTTVVGEPPGTGSNGDGQSCPHVPTGDAAGELMSSRNTHDSSRHRHESALRTSSTVSGTASSELVGGKLVPELERLRVVRLTALAVSDAIFVDAVAMTIAVQSRAARLPPPDSDVSNVLDSTR